MRLLRPVVLGLIAATLAVGPVAAESVFEISETGTLTPGMKSRATLVFTINCVSDPAYPTGTATVALEQEQRGGVVTGTGTTTVTCDGVTRTYSVTIDATNGEFRRGSATASGEATFLYTLCAVNEQGEMMCFTFPQRMVADSQPVELRVGR
jgi:hypothetical protein